MSTILVDLDHTLLNNAALKLALAESLELSPEDWQHAYEQFVQDNGTFEPKAFLQGVAPAQRRAFDQTVAKARTFLYSDSIQFLEAAHDKKYHIVLVTFGNVAWQRQKLAALRLPTYVTLLPTDTTKTAVLADYIEDDTLLIDDNAYEIDEIIKQWPHIKAYWMKRLEGKYRTHAPQYPHTTITSLAEINL